MERTYDIFEILADGSPVWRACVTGHEATISKMRELAANSKNEFRVMHLPTQSIVAIANPKQEATSSDKDETVGTGGEHDKPPEIISAPARFRPRFPSAAQTFSAECMN